MSLIKCPECNREISGSALNCPHCGYPIETKRKELGNRVYFHYFICVIMNFLDKENATYELIGRSVYNRLLNDSEFSNNLEKECNCSISDIIEVTKLVIEQDAQEIYSANEAEQNMIDEFMS